jgi:hypothetical protein
MNGIRRRLARLEQRCLPPPSNLSLVCVDEQGVMLDDRSEAVRPWVGRYCSELPESVKVIVGVDPPVVLGYKELGDEPGTDDIPAGSRLNEARGNVLP